jgi:hypothetical protein
VGTLLVKRNADDMEKIEVHLQSENAIILAHTKLTSQNGEGERTKNASNTNRTAAAGRLLQPFCSYGILIALKRWWSGNHAWPL